MAGAVSGGSSALALRDASARMKMRRGKNKHDFVGIRTGARARRARSADGRRVVVAGTIAGRRRGRAYDVTGEYSNRVELV